MSTKIYINEDNFKLYLDDSFSRLKKIKSGTVNMIFSDPPYFLSGEGITCKSGKMESVKKADWDEKISLKEKLKFNRSWIKQCHRILDNNGSLWISGTMHNIYTIGYALELENFKIINNITWRKLNPPPNISCRAFTHSTETVIWAKKNLPKSKHLFNYDLVKEINGGKQMKDVWDFPLTKPSEKKEGKHPTQKPLDLLRRIILSSTKEGDLILDPFCGSGTTGIAAIELNRNFIGIDNEINYLEIAKRRYIKMINSRGLL
ncbi:MAG: site-specific DNA-methyltransferase [Candidatus Izemoplasmatales bacterium]|nr:site-specific DNA-methyltransferase [Candidatus Izemoplasmatales bacterium]MDY0139520.1 site-specific DNA-methyltransferase [Candidatus Izemoplasmatales bacterium]